MAMVDMLVNLMDLPEDPALREKLGREKIRLVRALSVDKRRVLRWLEEQDFAGFVSECDVCFAHTPVSCFLAIGPEGLLGVACYDATAPDFFGPTVVAPAARGKGIGKALLLCALEALREEGYAYAVIGGVGPAAFYEKCVGARVIPGSTPGIYRRMIAYRAPENTADG